MKVIRPILFVFPCLALLFGGCATNQTPVPISDIPAGATDWVIIDPPQQSPRVTFPDHLTGTDVTKAWAQLSNSDILNLLSNTHSQISVGKFDTSGGITYLAASVTASAGSYQVIIFYYKKL